VDNQGGETNGNWHTEWTKVRTLIARHSRDWITTPEADQLHPRTINAAHTTRHTLYGNETDARNRFRDAYNTN